MRRALGRGGWRGSECRGWHAVAATTAAVLLLLTLKSSGGAWESGGAGSFRARSLQQLQPGNAHAGEGGERGNRLELGSTPPHCAAAAVNATPAIFGEVKKAGALDLQNWHANFTTQRQQAYLDWRASRVVSPYSSQHFDDGTALPPPLVPHCRVFVNHAYRTIYLRAPKTGSTALLELLGSCSQLADPASSPTCFESLEATDAASYEAMWREYFVFGVVRNPWRRAVSSYRMLTHYVQNQPQCRAALGWDAFCREPARMAMVHNQHPECDTLTNKQGENFAMHHIIPQAPCLLTPDGGWAADYLLRTERLEEDAPRLLELINERRRPETAPLDVPTLLAALNNPNAKRCDGEREGTKLVAPEQYCDETRYFAEQHAPCFEAVSRYYADDVRAAGLGGCPLSEGMQAGAQE